MEDNNGNSDQVPTASVEAAVNPIEGNSVTSALVEDSEAVSLSEAERAGDMASNTSSAVTLETLSEDSGVHPTSSSVASTANGGHHINHPLLTPTSPRSVTTASMSASGE